MFDINFSNIRRYLGWWLVGLVNGFLLAATVGFARGIDMTKAGVSLWIFLSVGACIILLQVIPALILFVAFLNEFRRRGSQEERH